MECANKSVIVAGGLGGIGLATCNELLAKGVKNLGIFDIADNADLLKKLADSFPRAKVKFWKVDATKKGDVQYAFQNALVKFSTIDVLINCVGVVDEEHVERCIEINLLASVYLNYTAIDFMSKAKGGAGGTVVNVSSMAGLKPFPLCVVYSATKYGLIGLTTSLGNDFYFSKTGMKFIAICPGFTETSLVKGEFNSPIHDVAHLPKSLKYQSAESCGSCLVAALEQNKNGSIWQIEHQRLNEVIPPDYDV